MKLINLTSTVVSGDQYQRGVRDIPGTDHKRLLSILKDDHPSSSRYKLKRAAREIVELASKHTADDTIRSVMIRLDGNLRPHLMRELTANGIVPYYWEFGRLVLLPQHADTL